MHAILFSSNFLDQWATSSALQSLGITHDLTLCQILQLSVLSEVLSVELSQMYWSFYCLI